MLQSVAIPAGTGKTHLAVALADRAVEAGHRGYFTTADDMCKTLIRVITTQPVVEDEDLHCTDRARHR